MRSMTSEGAHARGRRVLRGGLVLSLFLLLSDIFGNIEIVLVFFRKRLFYSAFGKVSILFIVKIHTGSLLC